MNEITLADFRGNLKPEIATLLANYSGSPISLLSEIIIAMKKTQDQINATLPEDSLKINVISEFAFSNPTPEEGKWVQLQSIGLRIKYELKPSEPYEFKAI